MHWMDDFFEAYLGPKTRPHCVEYQVPTTRLLKRYLPLETKQRNMQSNAVGQSPEPRKRVGLMEKDYVGREPLLGLSSNSGDRHINASDPPFLRAVER